MVATCLHLAGFVCSFIGWIGVVVATATNDWVVTCGYTITTCRKMDELGSKGLWADCVMATGLYHCKPLVDILILPGTCPPPCPRPSCPKVLLCAVLPWGEMLAKLLLLHQPGRWSIKYAKE